MKTPKKYTSGILANLLDKISDEQQHVVDRKMMIAQKIYLVMQQKNISKKQLAEMLEVQPSVVTKWLSGTHNFTLETLARIEHTLGVDLLNVNLAKPVKKLVKSNKFEFSNNMEIMQIAI